MYTCIILYIDKLIFKTCTVCSYKKYCVLIELRGIVEVNVVLNKKVFTSYSSPAICFTVNNLTVSFSFGTYDEICNFSYFVCGIHWRPSHV